MVRAGEVPHVLLQSFCQRRWMSGTECSLLRANVAKRHATVAWNQPSPYSFRHTVLGLALCLRFEARVDYQETVVNLDVYDGRDDLSSSAQRACTSNDPEVRRLCIGHVSGGASGLLSTFARERMRRLPRPGEWAPPACSPARVRRERQCSSGITKSSLVSIFAPASSSPLERRLPLALLSKAECKRLPLLDDTAPHAACLISNVYFHDGTWFFVSDAENTTKTRWLEGVAVAARKSFTENKKRPAGLALEVITKSKLLSQLHETTEQYTHRLGSRHSPLHILTRALLVFIHQVEIGDGHGHTLHDMALPIFWALDLFFGGTGHKRRFEEFDIQVLLAHHEATPYDEWLALVATRPPLFQTDLACFHCPPRAWCRAPSALMGISEGLGYYGNKAGAGGGTSDRELLSLRAPIYAAFGDAVRSSLFPGQSTASSSHEGAPPCCDNGALVRRGSTAWQPRRQRGNHHIVFLQRQHSRMAPNLRVLEDQLHWELQTVARGAGRRPPAVTFITAATDAMSMREQALLLHEATVVFAVEGGALDNILLAPRGLAAIVVGRDPSVSFPDGCATSATSHDEPFTHRPLFRALSRHLCAVAYIEAIPGSGTEINVTSAAQAFRRVVAECYK
jgi:hypothetical protein